MELVVVAVALGLWDRYWNLGDQIAADDCVGGQEQQGQDDSAFDHGFYI